MSIYGISVLLGGTNMFVAVCEQTRAAMIVDFCDRNPARWGRGLQEIKANVDKVVQTHALPSRKIDLRELKQLSFFSPHLKIMAHESESALSNVVDDYLQDGMVISVGNLRFKCFHVPGPTVGSCTLYEESEGVAFTGDLISRGGRMWRSVADPLSLKDSLTRLIKEVPETTLLFPSHYGLTSMGAERRANPELMGLKGGAPLMVQYIQSDTEDPDKVRKTKRWVI